MGLFNGKKKKSAAKYEDLSESKKIKYIIRFSKQNRVIDYRAVGLLRNFKNICLFLRQAEFVYSEGDGRSSENDARNRWEFLDAYFKRLKSRGYPDLILTQIQVEYLLGSIPGIYYSGFSISSILLIHVFQFINHTLDRNKTAVHELLLKSLRENSYCHLEVLSHTNFHFDPKILRKLLKEYPFSESERLYLSDFWDKLALDIGIGLKTKEQLTKIVLDSSSSDDLDALSQLRISQLERQVELLTSQLATLRRSESDANISSLSFFGGITSPSETSKYDDINPSSDRSYQK